MAGDGASVVAAGVADCDVADGLLAGIATHALTSTNDKAATPKRRTVTTTSSWFADRNRR